MVLSFLGLPLRVTCHPPLNTPNIHLPSLRDHKGAGPTRNCTLTITLKLTLMISILPPCSGCSLKTRPAQPHLHPPCLLGLPNQIRTPQTIFMFSTSQFLSSILNLLPNPIQLSSYFPVSKQEKVPNLAEGSTFKFLIAGFSLFTSPLLLQAYLPKYCSIALCKDHVPPHCMSDPCTVPEPWPCMSLELQHTPKFLRSIASVLYFLHCPLLSLKVSWQGPSDIVCPHSLTSHASPSIFLAFVSLHWVFFYPPGHGGSPGTLMTIQFLMAWQPFPVTWICLSAHS